MRYQIMYANINWVIPRDIFTNAPLCGVLKTSDMMGWNKNKADPIFLYTILSDIEEIGMKKYVVL